MLMKPLKGFGWFLANLGNIVLKLQVILVFKVLKQISQAIYARASLELRIGALMARPDQQTGAAFGGVQEQHD